MKILYIIANADFYGSERHLFDLIQENLNTHQLMLLAFSDGALVRRVKEMGIPTVVLNENRWKFGLKSLMSIRHIVIDFSPNIVHSHQPRGIFWGSIVSFFLRINHISTIHSTALQHSKNYTGIKAHLVWVFQEIVRFCAEALSIKSIFVSHTSGKRSFFPSKSTVIHNWVSIPLGMDRQRTRLDSTRFLCVSSLAKAKGIIELLELFSKLCVAIPGAQLEIVGDGKEIYKIDIRSSIQKLNLQTSVTLSGYIESVSEKYLVSDVFISMTQDETFGLVFVEAMACGLPIVCSDLPILREIIPSWNCFVPLSQQINASIVNQIVNFSANCESASNQNYIWARTHFRRDTNIGLVSKLYELIFSEQRI